MDVALYLSQSGPTVIVTVGVVPALYLQVMECVNLQYAKNERLAIDPCAVCRSLGEVKWVLIKKKKKNQIHQGRERGGRESWCECV